MKTSSGIPAGIIVILLFTFSWTLAEDLPLYQSETIVVTAERIPTTFSDVARSVVVIGRDEIEKTPAQSIQGLLECALGVDIKQRGVSGVQADVGIRGGTFEQTLVLLDGVKVNNPQTGHHNLDIPVNLDDIERIEVLKGHGSRLYGPNAFGGVINIITRQDRQKRASVAVSAADFRSSEAAVSLSYPLGPLAQRVSVSRKKSDGYYENTDYDVLSASYNSSVGMGVGELRLSAGYVDKEFGAYKFYSDAYPNEWEHTSAAMTSISLRTGGENIYFSPRIYWNNHFDDFLLERYDPDFFRNKHTTNCYGMDFQFDLLSLLGATAFGGEIGNEDINSSSFGEHSRKNYGLFLEHRIDFHDRLTSTLGAYAYNYAGLGWDILPGVDIGIHILNGLDLYGTAGRSYRVPTYTELYYDSPSNKGNPDLEPEYALAYEAGLKWRVWALNGGLSYFRQESEDLIDWVRAEASEPWQAQNIGEVNTDGVEMNVGFSPSGYIEGFPIIRTQISYAYLDLEKELGGLESKYALNQLRHQLLLDLDYTLPLGIRQDWRFRYEDRINYGDYFLIDTRISYSYEWIGLFAEMSNLLDTKYEEIGGIPAAGRWGRVGMEFFLKSKD